MAILTLSDAQFYFPIVNQFEDLEPEPELVGRTGPGNLHGARLVLHSQFSCLNYFTVWEARVGSCSVGVWLTSIET